MIPFLRGLFIVIIVSMLWVTSWASLQCPLFAIPRAVFTHPWFIATLFDAYWAFITFFVWVCFKQTTLVARLAWFVAIILLGNIAMACYCLKELFQVPTDSKISVILVERRNGPSWLGLALAGLGVVVTLLGLKQ